MKKLFIFGALLYVVPIVAAETKEPTAYQDLLSQEIVFAEQKGEELAYEKVKEWRKEYELLWQKNPPLSMKEFKSFFTPVLKGICNKYSEDVSETNASAGNQYSITFSQYIDGQWKKYRSNRIDLSQTGDGNFYSIGRHAYNPIAITGEGHLQVSRLHLLLTRLPDGSGLVLDPFSSCGTSEVVSRDTAEFEEFAREQAHHNKLMVQGQRNVFIKKFSTDRPLVLRMGVELVEIQAVANK